MRRRITSRRNPGILALRGLKRREERLSAGRLIVEGVRSIEEAVDAGARIREVLVSPHLIDSARCADLCERLEALGAEVIEATDEVIAAVSDAESPQGIVAAADIPGRELRLGANPLVIVVDSLADPGNLGTVIRTAAALGADGVVVAGRGADPLSPKCVRATMGSVFRVPVQVRPDIGEALLDLKERGVTVVVGDASAAEPCYSHDFTQPSAIVVGSEATGASARALELADVAVQVPMPGRAESLNAAVAAAILMYEAVRQRRAGLGQAGSGCCGFARRCDIMGPQE